MIAIIGILIALLLPAVQAAREAARRLQCGNNLRQVGLALHNYIASHKCFPPGGMSENELSWLVMILPYIEQNTLYEQFDFNEGDYKGPNKNEIALNRVAAFLCPSSNQERSNLGTDISGVPEQIDGVDPYTTHYIGVMGPKGINPVTGEEYNNDGYGNHGGHATQGVLLKDRCVCLSKIIDGTSNTFAVGEISWNKYTRFRTWVRGSTIDGSAMGSCKNVAVPINLGIDSYLTGGTYFNDGAFGSQHPGGAHFGMCDGAVKFVSGNVDFGVFLSTASRDGAEIEVIY